MTRLSARNETLWTLGGFLGLAVAFVAVMDLRFPHWTDREYAARRQIILDRQADHPDRPFLAVIGSSRVGAGFVPEELSPIHDTTGRCVNVFNVSHLGAGPRMNLLQLHRLLRDGIKPRWVVLELFVPHLQREPTTLSELSLPDVGSFGRYWQGDNLAGKAAEYRLTAMVRYRGALLESIAPEFSSVRPVSLRAYGGDSGWLRRESLGDGERAALRRTVERQCRQLIADWRMDPLLDGATRDLLMLCRERGIRVALVLFPETTEFRSWYGPGVEDQIQDYLARLRFECGIPIHDARDWMPDACFIDQHHLSNSGAAEFSARLEKEVIAPLVHADPP
jgi:hypothetical protein